MQTTTTNPPKKQLEQICITIRTIENEAVIIVENFIWFSISHVILQFENKYSNQFPGFTYLNIIRDHWSEVYFYDETSKHWSFYQID